jgi:EAL domain-containing protein (putative c-di-GMP-specific phosphodiesterase class I)/ActR/RegA family two-component response regulator
MGGDEFVILLAELAHSEDVSSITQKILATTALPFLIDGHELFVTCSIGASLYPSDGNDVQTLLKNADAAMYRAKETGRNTVQYFTKELNARAFERLLMENNLRHALERGELLLYFQPQVNLSSGRITGVEALVRWQHPELGMISPGDFIPLAEESGLIVSIGEWVLRTACAQNKAWQVAGLPPLCVAVNLSARQFRQDLPSMVARVLQETGLEACYLELEITESIIMQNPDEAAATLHKLKEMGISLAIDDFGTGYSSLSYLKRFPIDRLKIDQSFVRDITTDPDDAAIAMAVIAMAHSLNLKVVAEGVETEAQLSYLHRRQCDEFQGYFFSRPEPSENIAHQLAQDRSVPAELLSQQSTHSVLLVDDEPAVSAAMARALRRSGYQILTATSAQEGFELLATHAIQVVVSDQRMPGMTGAEFLSRVRDIYPETVRIVVSGTSDIESLSQTINRGAIFKFLIKPWEDGELRNSIDEAFRFYEARESR